MAARYWVGGSASWNATVGTKWAATSGGAGGQSVPTPADDVFFDANSGAVTVNITGGSVAICANFSMAGFTGAVTLTGNLQVVGNAVLKNNTMTGAGALLFVQAAGTPSLTFNGATLPNLKIGATSADTGSVTFQDASIVAGLVTLAFGGLNTNGKACAWGGYSGSNTNTRSLTGASTITFGAAGVVTVWDVTTPTNFTMGPGFVLKIVPPDTFLKTFRGGGLPYESVYVVFGAGGGNVVVSGSNTFTQAFDARCTATATLAFGDGDTQTFRCPPVFLGAPGQPLTMDSVSGTGTPTTLVNVPADSDIQNVNMQPAVTIKWLPRVIRTFTA